MTYIQYFERSACDPTKFIETCGDRGVIITDGRYNLETLERVGRDNNGIHRPFYHAFQIFKGESLLRSKAVSILYRTNK
jgi:hypothetical protein